MNTENIAVVIAAAGNSTRMEGVDKIFAPLGGKAVISRTIESFLSLPYVNEIVVVTSKDNFDRVLTLTKNIQENSKIKVVLGGGDRMTSVINGIEAITAGVSLVAVHDGARPLVKKEDIDKVISLANKTGAAILGVRAKDTVKVVNDGQIADTPQRKTLFLAQTPQVFSLSIYREIIKSGIIGSYTDDSGIFEERGIPVSVAEGSYDNIKITSKEDLILAEALLLKRNSRKDRPKKLRVGIGYDVHSFAPNRRLVLGGVLIPFETGLLGHSDADVLCHAITDALLGAAAMGDIGKSFPDTDPLYKDADSINLLNKTVLTLYDKGGVIENIDAVIIAEKPKLSPYIEKIRDNIAAACLLETEDVSVKATTEENLGLKGEGIGVKAVALVNI